MPETISSTPGGGENNNNVLAVIDQAAAERAAELKADVTGERPRIKSALEIAKDAKRSAAWAELDAHLKKWYFDFDMQAMRIALSAVAAHKNKKEEPIWLFIQGGSGTGKTVLINALTTFQGTHVMGALTPQTFLSGFRNGKCSALTRMGDDIVMLFKDFTTFLSLRPEARGEIASQLREIYDGWFKRDTGATSKPLEWRGKATVIAATTPAVERAWVLLRDLGERFVTVRWPEKDPLSLAEAAANQIDQEKEITHQTKVRVKAILDCQLDDAKIPQDGEEFKKVKYLAAMTARCRAHVSRENEGKRRVNDVPEPEGPTRLMKSFLQLAKSHANLHGRPVVTGEDFEVCKRVAVDSIPGVRKRIFKVLVEEMDSGAGEIECPEVAGRTGLPLHTVLMVRDELEALRIVHTEQSMGEQSVTKWMTFTEEFKEVVKIALR